ncbi:MAG TPA: TetR/AcrR family transcriptional regulator [Nocardioides sp.]|nr:TetR/AcrR family transcriptional regulator [Nocardioides sp.]
MEQRTDRRTERREAALRRIVAAAWELSAERGLTGWTLRDLGAAVGMRAPSLYVYVDSKSALYDLLFAEGYQALLDEMADLADDVGEPRERLRRAAHRYVAFCVAEPARCQLLFLRTIPGFEPSPESYALAVHTLGLLAQGLADAGIREPAELDLWTAVLTGLATQQISNDPGGDRWSRLVDTAVDRLLT